MQKDDFIAAIKAPLTNLNVCRADNQGDKLIGYFDAVAGCVYSSNGVITKAIDGFEILAGTGFSWAVQNKSAPLHPNALVAGTQSKANLYVGRHNSNGTSHIGKVESSGEFHYDDNGVVDTENVQLYDILLC